MNFEVKLSVQEILENKHFEHARVIAGKTGLCRLIRWVHVLEVTSISNLLSGNELILTTGIGWKGNIDTFRSLVQQSIDSNAAGLCIELGMYIETIPEEIINLANLHDFPLIVFQQEVRFVDITQEVHSLLIKKQYQILSDLEKYSNRLNQLLLSPNPQQKILQFLHDYLKMTVFYISKQEKVQVYSKKTLDEQDRIFRLLKGNKISKYKNVAHKSVQALHQIFADLFIISDSEVTDFELLILDRSATALAQCLLRELYLEEQRKAKEAEWISCWLDGKHNNEQIYKYLYELEPNLKPNGGTVLLCKADNLDKVISEFTYLKVYFRSVFEQRGILMFSHIHKNQMIFILLNNWKLDDFKRRVRDGIECLKRSDFIKKLKFARLDFSVGKIVHQLNQVSNSYYTAKETLSIREKMPNRLSNYFYEDLYIFRLVLAANERGH